MTSAFTFKNSKSKWLQGEKQPEVNKRKVFYRDYDGTTNKRHNDIENVTKFKR